MSIYIPEDRRHKNKNSHEHYIGNKQNNNFSPTMSISIMEDRLHTCIKLGIDIIKISSNSIGNNYVLSFVIYPLQPINWSEYYLCPSNLSSHIIYLSICISNSGSIHPSIYWTIYCPLPCSVDRIISLVLSQILTVFF